MRENIFWTFLIAYFVKMWILIICCFFSFFVVDNLCAFYNCLQIEDLNLKFEKKRKTTPKKNPSKFYDHFNEQISFFKRKEYIFRKNKKWINLSSRQKKSKLPVVILETVSHEPIKNPLSSAPEVSVCFLASIRLLPGSRLEKLQEKIWMQNW